MAIAIAVRAAQRGASLVYRLIGVNPASDHVTITNDGRVTASVVIETDPANEIIAAPSQDFSLAVTTAPI